MKIEIQSVMIMNYETTETCMLSMFEITCQNKSEFN